MEVTFIQLLNLIKNPSTIGRVYRYSGMKPLLYSGELDKMDYSFLLDNCDHEVHCFYYLNDEIWIEIR